MPARRTSQQITDEIISKLDIAAEYIALGVKLAADHPTDKGWISCYAWGREDSSPSAAINVDSGVYKDHGGVHTTCGMFDFSVMAGKFRDWKDARDHYATVAGMGAKLPKTDATEPKRLEDKIDVSHGWNSLMVRGLLATYPGMTELALRMTGAALALYPKHRKRPEHCVAVPVYGPQLADSPPVGYIVMLSSGKMLKTKSGEQKRIVIEKTGLVNKRGLAMISDGRAKLIIKVEGFTDVVTVQGKVNEHEVYRDTIAVITNACGSRETTLPCEVAGVFSTIPTIVVHDADLPGQEGAELWRQELVKFTDVVNLQLPYKIEEKHGKDSRDWFTEHVESNGASDTRGIEQFLEMVREQFPGFMDAFDGKKNETGVSDKSDSGNGIHRNNGNHSGNGAIPQNRLPKNEVAGDEGKNHSGLPDKSRVAESPASPISPTAAILKRIGMIVLGNPEGTDDVVGFCTKNGRTFTIKNVDNLKYERLLLHLGGDIKHCINRSSEPDPNKLEMPAIREAISEEGFKNRLTGSSYFGVGIWELSGRLLLVNAGEATIVNCEVSRTTVPLIEDRIFDFGENRKWFNHDWFAAEFERNSEREYSMSVLNEAIEVFARWDNWKHSKTPEIIAALVCCTWVQNVWDWRPQACIVGSTNSGKTMLIRTLRGMFAGGDMTVGGMSPSAAGIRQKLRNTSKAVIVDEFEPHSKHRKECLEMFRGMSRGDSVPRGVGGNQRGLDFVMKHLPWHGAIAADMASAADRNRYLMIELLPVKLGRGSTLQIPTSQECCEIGLKLMAVAVKYWAPARDLANRIKKAYIEGIDRRLVESFSVPCGMIAAILGLSEAEAIELTREVIGEQDLAEQSESDEQSLLRDIFESPVQLESGKQATMSVLVKGTLGSAYGAGDAMIRCGVKKFEAKDGTEWLFFVESSICANLFRDPTKKNIGVAQILGRIDGAKKNRQYMGMHKPRGIALPFAKVKELLGTVEGEEDQQTVDEIGKGLNAEISELTF